MCVVLGALLMALSIPVQYVNRTVLDAPTFADRVDQLRQRDDVSQALGRDLSGDIIARSPDLVALAPLLEQVATGVIASDALSGPVRLAAAQFNRALTTGDSEQLVLRLADAGSVVAAAVAVIAPERAPNASNVGVTLAEIGSQGFASDMIGIADKVDTMAWLLPMLMFVALAAAVLLDPDRWATDRTHRRPLQRRVVARLRQRRQLALPRRRRRILASGSWRQDGRTAAQQLTRRSAESGRVGQRRLQQWR